MAGKRAFGVLLAVGVGIFLTGPALARDTTPPVITSTTTGTVGAEGWFTSDVNLAWTVTDPESRIYRKSGCGTASVTSDTSGTVYRCSATSSGGISTKSVTIKLDATAPSATITAPASGASFVIGQAVAANFTCSDARSLVASCVGTVANGGQVDTATAGSKTFKVTATDHAGNVKTVTATYTVSDRTAPVINSALSGTLGSNGWYTSNVGVTWSVTDPESPITMQTGCGAATLTSDSAGTTYTCSATSAGGSSSKSVTVKRDATKPVASITTPAAGATYLVNQSLTAAFTCSDARSGMASCVGTVANGAAVSTSTAGTRTFTVTATDLAGNVTTASVTYTVGSATPVGTAGTQLFAWNDLGMHCADSDYSVFTLLPPFNNLNAQLVVAGKLVTTGYTLTYESAADPATGSITTSSSGKTNFWQYAPTLFKANLAPDYGLTGNRTATATPAPLQWSSAFNWFEATGIPIMPVDDANRSNAYPMVKVSARNGAGQLVASSTTVLPVSSEINCFTCHASNTGSAAAKPAAGWFPATPGSERDWRMNILRLHDEKNAANPAYAPLMSSKGYGTSLELSALNNTPILCDTCHNSNALAIWGIGGVATVSNMTAAMHNRHASVSLPGSSATLDSNSTRDTCYNCHPGKNTQCLRGAMGNPVNANGDHTMECQSCHGSMKTVGNLARNGWFDMPTCQSCHHDGLRETVAINANGTFKAWSDVRFASNANTPAAGVSLFRFSTGHGNMQCEACHNSTHAEFTDKPSTNGNSVNDNRRAVAAQGYAAAIRECTVCHTSMPSTTNGGPHGMHPIGASWVSRHENVVSSSNRADCLYCHGSTSAGSPLAVIKVAKTFSVGDGRTKSFAVNERVTCWSCHNGPSP